LNALTERTSDDFWQDEIERLEEESRVAFLAQDLDRLRQLWSENLSVNSPINRIHDRSQVLDLLEKESFVTFPLNSTSSALRGMPT
jgi:hypothetical protein